MPRTFPVKLEVEEIALGTVLRKLHDMPGVAKLELDFGHGGQGAGRKQLEEAAQSDPRRAIADALGSGPKSAKEIAELIGGGMVRVHNLLYELKRAGVTRSAGHGKHMLAVKQKASAPAITHGPGGRASTGSGNVLVVGMLKSEHAPVPPHRLRTFLGNNGMSPKSVTGVLARAKRDGLIKKDGNGYVLTAKASKLNGEAHG